MEAPIIGHLSVPPAVAAPAKRSAHLKLKMIKLIDRAIEAFMFITATIMVVPVVTATVKYTVCLTDEEGNWILQAAPDVIWRRELNTEYTVD